jgi:lipopolysaccharide/colanic/teichoic acid biosynthesis glycosyltransferase
LAQISGRNSLTWEDRFRLDVQYVDQHTFVGDLKILLATVRVVSPRDDAPDGRATMPEFLGTDVPKEGE